ncbi:MAG: hypothetical protein FRX48_03627 [Lasallia pustulata]|uniref:Uncharacterized protein n=1 Tax=Lasallia pustulata TaxID=136370 RepID=A0A5M8PUH3_9LECA|nr:MAG: hypothetical protein FRX48_03627 [Lasallia pustulata]
MYVAGVCKFIPANTFPFAVSVIYGCQWCQIAYSEDPLTLMSFVSFLGAMRTKSPCALAIFGLNFLFAFVAAASFINPLLGRWQMVPIY